MKFYLKIERTPGLPQNAEHFFVSFGEFQFMPVLFEQGMKQRVYSPKKAETFTRSESAFLKRLVVQGSLFLSGNSYGWILKNISASSNFRKR